MEQSTNLTQSIQRATALAASKRHEFVTPEHLLLAMLDDAEALKTLTGVGANLVTLRGDLEDYVNIKLKNLVLSSPKAPLPSQALRKMFQRAEMSAELAEKKSINSTMALIAMMGDVDSFGACALKTQQITQTKLINFASHGTVTGNQLAKTQQPPAAKPQPTNENDEEEDTRSALERFTVNLNEKAMDGRIDPLVGRDTEVSRVIQTLSLRKKNNPILVGDPGTGKTAIAEGFAQRIITGDVPEELEDCTIYSLDLAALMAGTKYRGEFEKRMKALITELQSIPQSVLLIDEIHMVIGAGGGSMDVANILKPALSDGSIKCIGATTYAEYRKYFEKDAAMSRRFQKIDVSEPSIEDAVLTLNGVSKHLERFHNVQYTPEAIRAAVELSAKYITDRCLPDKAIDVLDATAAHQILVPPQDRVTVFEVTHIEDTIAQMTNTPKKTISADETAKMAALSDNLKAKVFGQDHAVDTLVDAFQVARAGLGDTNKPLGSFLLDGPTGVGKTELTKQLGEELGMDVVRFDMSEYMERHAVSRLIGAPPGYVGYDQGGLLTEAVNKKPHSIILLDEIEKAHPDMFNILLQVMDHGTLTDNTGKKADFRNAIIIMTTNVSVNGAELEQVSVGFSAGYDDEPHGAEPEASEALKRKFPPEFRNRLDAVVAFGALPQDVIGSVADKFLNQLKDQLAKKNIVMERSDAVVDHLARVGYDPQMGARPMARVINEQIKKPLSKAVLFGELVNGGSVKIDLDDDHKIKFSFNALAAPANDTGAKDAEIQKTLLLAAPKLP